MYCGGYGDKIPGWNRFRVVRLRSPKGRVGRAPSCCLAFHDPKGEFGRSRAGELLEFVSLILIDRYPIRLKAAEQRGYRLPIKVHATSFGGLNGQRAIEACGASFVQKIKNRIFDPASLLARRRRGGLAVTIKQGYRHFQTGDLVSQCFDLNKKLVTLLNQPLLAFHVPLPRHAIPPWDGFKIGPGEGIRTPTFLAGKAVWKTAASAVSPRRAKPNGNRRARIHKSVCETLRKRRQIAFERAPLSLVHSANRYFG